MLENKNSIYLDYSATTPVDDEVREIMQPYFTEIFGNPSSLHTAGQDSRRAIDDARERVKKFLGADVLREVIFTGSATEANNLAIYGAVRQVANAFDGAKPHIIATSIEHKSVLSPYEDLETGGDVEVTYLRVESDGLISLDDLKDSLKKNTALVSIIYANNEIGVIQPIKEIAEIVKTFRESNNSKYPLLHIDAAQAAGFLNMNVGNLGVDMLTISGHKIYGPKGVGALFIKDGVRIKPQIVGGEQEYGMRSGTESVPLIAGLGMAVEITDTWKSNKQNIEKMTELQNYLIDKLFKIPNTELNGSRDKRLPGNINITFNGVDSENLLIALSEEGVYISAGSACQARGQKLSHVLHAIGKNDKKARSSIRISLGRSTTKDDVDVFLLKLNELIEKK